MNRWDDGRHPPGWARREIDQTGREGPPVHPSLAPYSALLEENRQLRMDRDEARARVAKADAELEMWQKRARAAECDLDATRDELEHAERKLAGEWPYNVREMLLERADFYEKDGEPGPLASWGWGDVAKELRAVAELFEGSLSERGRASEILDSPRSENGPEAAA